MYKTILVPIAASEFSDAAIEAARVAKELRSKLVFFYAVPRHHLSPLTEGVSAPGRTDERKIAIEEWEPEAEKRLTSAAGNVHLAGTAIDQQFTLSNSAHETIIEAAKKSQCELIIMASHGRRGLAGVLLGTETQKGLTYSAIPVLVDSISANQRQIQFALNIHQRKPEKLSNKYRSQSPERSPITFPSDPHP